MGLEVDPVVDDPFTFILVAFSHLAASFMALLADATFIYSNYVMEFVIKELIYSKEAFKPPFE